MHGNAQVLYLKSSAASAPSAQSTWVASGRAPPPTRCNGQGTSTSCTMCSSPSSNTMVSPGLLSGQHFSQNFTGAAKAGRLSCRLPLKLPRATRGHCVL